jgi:hypothetical protein
MMNVRILRLYRAQKVLPSIIRRAFASEANTDAVSSSTDTPPSATNGSEVTEDALKIIKELSKLTPEHRRNGIGIIKAMASEVLLNGSKDPTKIASARRMEVRKMDWRDYQGTPPQTPSKVHWALSDMYELGGVIPRGKDRYHTMGDGGLPLWGEWGVQLRIRTFGVLSICTMWVPFAKL